ncbi:hypothetical protein FB567DRAFT_573905 [Paraphoma chrysanthemicola]|uniref:Uncharacterized protein n=1 Tax=Paraphoma chrysanthemicola TaxID=798071 RepID=A0A8K0VSG8_9PLEO|nr:hypothetical protein FB567DRAFT_573905 [Paraphoma chrysanthemicola]
MARRRPLSPAHGGLSMRRGDARHQDHGEASESTEGQQMLAVGSLLRRPKSDDKEVQQFRTEVAAERERIKAQLDLRVCQAEEEEQSRRNEIASAIRNALQTPNRRVQGRVPTFPTTTIAENAVYIPIANVLATTDDLVTQYESLDKLITGMRDDQAGPLAETWHQELEETERQLRMGARVALRNVKKVLGADFDNENVAAKDDAEEMVENEEDEKELNYELQNGLRYAERGVKRMVKGLPMEECS